MATSYTTSQGITVTNYPNPNNISVTNVTEKPKPKTIQELFLEAVIDGNLKLCQALLPHVDINKVTPTKFENNTTFPLLEAVFHGHTEIVELLIKNNVNPMQVDSDGNNPLHVAVITTNWL